MPIFEKVDFGEDSRFASRRNLTIPNCWIRSLSGQTLSALSPLQDCKDLIHLREKKESREGESASFYVDEFHDSFNVAISVSWWNGMKFGNEMTFWLWLFG
jgi:hypothetical protein